MPENRKYTKDDHTFVVCAYGESPYLNECIDSLLAQKALGKIIIATSTPNEHINGTAARYGLELRVNNEGLSERSTPISGIARDWNFAYKQAGTRLITLAHQDDIYLPEYLSTALEMVNKTKKPIIFFTHYAEMVGTKLFDNTLRLNIKKIMLLPIKIFKKSIFIRRRILSLGSPICCPSVMYVEFENLEFNKEFKCCLDWDKWEELSKLKGSFIYINKVLMYHRLHEGAETAKAIKDNIRREEDYRMFCKFWWMPIAKVLAGLYTKSEEDNGGQTLI